MFFKFRAPASALAPIFHCGWLAGVAAAAACLAGDAQTAVQPSYPAAALAGYTRAAAAPQPIAVKPAPAPDVRAESPTPRTVDCLATAVYYEARGESVVGREAVAQVILNRIHKGGWPKNVCAVVFQGRGSGVCQFSFACNGAMRGPREHLAWRDARRIATKVLAGEASNHVGAATYFHAIWAGMHRGAIRLGGQVFYT